MTHIDIHELLEDVDLAERAYKRDTIGRFAPGQGAGAAPMGGPRVNPFVKPGGPKAAAATPLGSPLGNSNRVGQGGVSTLAEVRAVMRNWSKVPDGTKKAVKARMLATAKRLGASPRTLALIAGLGDGDGKREAGEGSAAALRNDKAGAWLRNQRRNAPAGAAPINLAAPADELDVDLAPGDYTPPYDWKHGYIPLTPAAALSKAGKGPHAGKGRTRRPKGKTVPGQLPRNADGVPARKSTAAKPTTPMTPAKSKADDDAARGRTSTPSTPTPWDRKGAAGPAPVNKPDLSTMSAEEAAQERAKLARRAPGDKVTTDQGPGTVRKVTSRSTLVDLDDGGILNVAAGTPGHDRIRTREKIVPLKKTDAWGRSEGSEQGGDPKGMSPSELMTQRNRLDNYIAGRAGGTASDEDVARWQKRRDAVAAELETRTSPGQADSPKNARRESLGSSERDLQDERAGAPVSTVPAAAGRTTTSTNPDAPIRIQHGPDGTTVSGTTREDAPALKAAGFRWSRNIDGGAWYLNSTWGESARGQRVDRLAKALGDRAGIDRETGPRKSAAERDAQTRERAANRAERMDSRAEKRSAEADSRFKAADLREENSGIPFGQPILVGHHSERKHRRTLERAHNNLGKGVEASREAERAREAADRARRTAEGSESKVTTANRIRKLEAEGRDIDRKLAGTSSALSGKATGDYADRLRTRKAEIEDDLEFNRGELEAAGGVKASKETVSPGDFVKIRGQWYPVRKSNAKTVSIPHWGGLSSNDTSPWAEVQEHRKGSDATREDVANMIRETSQAFPALKQELAKLAPPKADEKPDADKAPAADEPRKLSSDRVLLGGVEYQRQEGPGGRLEWRGKGNMPPKDPAVVAKLDAAAPRSGSAVRAAQQGRANVAQARESDARAAERRTRPSSPETQRVVRGIEAGLEAEREGYGADENGVTVGPASAQVSAPGTWTARRNDDGTVTVLSKNGVELGKVRQITSGKRKGQWEGRMGGRTGADYGDSPETVLDGMYDSVQGKAGSAAEARRVAAPSGRSAGSSSTGQTTTTAANNKPSLTSPETLRRMSDEQLDAAYGRLFSGGDPDAAAVRAIEAELDRRDKARGAEGAAPSAGPLDSTADQLDNARTRFGVGNGPAVDALAKAIREQRWDDALTRAVRLQGDVAGNEAARNALQKIMERLAVAKRAKGATPGR